MAGLATEEIMAIIDSSTAKKERLFVEFYARDVPDEVKSLEFGYAQFKEVTYVKIFAPGEGTSQVVDKAASHCGARRGCSYLRGQPGEVPCDVHRFPSQYAAYQGNLDQQEASGLPLSQWPVVGKAQVSMLKAFGVHTVEQLAAVNDSALPALGPIRGLRQKAVDYVETARGLQPLQKLRAELESRDNAMANQQRQIEEMGKKIDELSKAQATAMAPPIIPHDSKPARR